MLIMGGALLLYLAGFAPFRQALQRVLGVDPAPGGNAAAPGGNPPAPGDGNPLAPGGLLHEVHSLLVGFFTSLLPGELNRQDDETDPIAVGSR